MKRQTKARSDQHVLITGGCGFIGTNLADRLLSEGKRVLVFDNLSRPGVERNLHWLREKHGANLDVELSDVRSAGAVRRAVKGASGVFHFAAQVAVTTSLEKPLHDFEVNVRGTLNLLEAIRSMSAPPPLVFTSTNKVYGSLDDVPLEERDGRYDATHQQTREHGISEQCRLDFHSPYGCSKGAADQYVIDYARSFGIPALVFRMSCIYGPHQFGNEDQGWVAHFLFRALAGETITLYGDGKQVRDVLFVEDLVDALLLGVKNVKELAGQAFNMGGGVAHTVSLLELIRIIDSMTRRKTRVEFDDWRTGDQRYYVSDTRRFRRSTGWEPKVEVREGVARLMQWIEESRAKRPQDDVVTSITPFRGPLAEQLEPIASKRGARSATSTGVAAK